MPRNAQFHWAHLIHFCLEIRIKGIRKKGIMKKAVLIVCTLSAIRPIFAGVAGAYYASTSSSSSGGGGGTPGGAAGGATTETPAQNDAAAVASRNMLSGALADATAANISSPCLSNYIKENNSKCERTTTEGLNKEAFKSCMVAKQRQKENTERIVKSLTAPPNVCIKKLDPIAMKCHARKIINHIVEDPEYKIRILGNIIEVYKKDRVIHMMVFENIHYDVLNKIIAGEKSDIVPVAVYTFNTLGQLIHEAGQLPVVKKDNPCNVCLKAVAKKTVDGEGGSCDNRCSSMFDLNDSSAFKTTQVKKPKPVEKREDDESNAATGP